MIVSELFAGVRATFRMLMASWRNRTLKRLRAAWGKAEAKEEPWFLSAYLDLAGQDPGAERVDDKTWIDLELDKIFAGVNTTLTQVGTQYLYRQFRNLADDAGRHDVQYRTYGALKEDANLRERIQLCLLGLQADTDALICNRLFGGAPDTLRFAWLIRLASAASVVFLILALLNHALWWLFVVGVCCNFLLLLLLGPHAHDISVATQRVRRMVSVASRLARIGADARVPALARLRDVFARFPNLKRSFIRMDMAADSLIASLLLYLNVAFLVDLVLATFMVSWMRALRAPLREVFELVGSLDASIAIASWLERLPVYCKPTITSRQAIELSDAYHPLIATPVLNSIHLDGQSALVVGTNMAGKTTFIKMVGANIILGRTLGVCCAASAVIPDSPVMACVRAEHSVQSGKSHFFAEIERIRAFVRIAAEARRGVFLIDEPFRGTNTHERIAIATAVLGEIATHAQALVTTHDVELQRLLGGKFLMFHFTEDPDLAEIFDYRLRPGASDSRNAIRLLEKIGFPPAVVEEARRVASQSGAI